MNAHAHFVRVVFCLGHPALFTASPLTHTHMNAHAHFVWVVFCLGHPALFTASPSLSHTHTTHTHTPHTLTHTHTHTHTHSHTHTHTYSGCLASLQLGHISGVHQCSDSEGWRRSERWVWVWVWVCACVYVGVCVGVRVCVCGWVCMYALWACMHVWGGVEFD